MNLIRMFINKDTPISCVCTVTNGFRAFETEIASETERNARSRNTHRPLACTVSVQETTLHYAVCAPSWLFNL